MLSFYFSTMQGGKSRTLLQRRHNLLPIGKSVAVVTSTDKDGLSAYIDKVHNAIASFSSSALFTPTNVD
jgi:thymidine kinase